MIGMAGPGLRLGSGELLELLPDNIRVLDGLMKSYSSLQK